MARVRRARKYTRRSSVKRRRYFKRTRPSKYAKRYKKKYTGYTRSVKVKLYHRNTISFGGNDFPYHNAMNWRLQDFTFYTQYTANFKQFKICAFKVKFWTSPLSYMLSVHGGMYFNWVDSLNLDGSASPTTIDSAVSVGTSRVITLQGQSVQPARSPGIITRYWKPNVSESAYSTGVTSYGLARKSNKTWLSCNDATDVVHYGYNLFMEARKLDGSAMGNSPASMAYQVTAYCKFRGNK